MTDDILILDPIAIQSKITDSILKKDIIMEDPTTPLAQQIEANVTSITDVSDGIINLERKLFPSMARTMSDLYPHFIDGDELDLFASPSSTTIRLYIEVQSLLNFGIKNDNTFTAVIPKETKIIVDELPFMLVNDLKVKLNNKRGIYNSFAELIHSDDMLEFKDIGSLNTSIIQDGNNLDWIIIDVPVKQLDMVIGSDRIISGYQFENYQEYSDELHHIEVYGTKINGEVFKLKKTYTEEYFDPTEPTTFIGLEENRIRIKVDSIYCGTHITDKIYVRIWSTKGKINLDMSNLNPDSFIVSIAGVTDTIEKAVAYKLNYMAYSTNIVDNGITTRSINDVRDRIIHRTSSNMLIPITEYQLRDRASLYGFDISKSTDLITERNYIASKDFTTFKFNVTPSLIKMHRTKIEYKENILDNKLIITDDYTQIKPGKLFGNLNGLITPLKNSDVDYIKSLTIKDKKYYFNTNDIFFNPFLYIIDNNIKTITNRIYDIDRPISDFLNIDAKNNFVNISVNIHEIHIFRSGDGYDILISLIGNEDFKKDIDNINIQLELKGEIANTFFHSKRDDTKTKEYFPTSDTMWYIRLESDLFIDINDRLNINNGYNESGSKSTLIDDVVSFIIYTTNENITVSSDSDAKSFLTDNDIQDNDDVEYGLSKEHSIFKLAYNLNGLWNRVDMLYTKDRYKTYNEDIPARYEKDIYKKVDGRPFEIIKNDDGSCSISKTILHKKGDIIKDDNGNIILQHKKGDIIFDNNEPVIDSKGGLMKYIDILMLEYKYVAFNTNIYIEHIDTIIKTLRLWVLDYINGLNNDMLEQTRLFYRPIRNDTFVINNDGYIYETVISPTVTIFISEDRAYNIDIVETHRNIGFILNNYFGKLKIDINALENDIKNNVVIDALAIKVSNYTRNDEKLIILQPNSNRFEMKKIIGNDYSILYDFKLDIKKI